jgi:hypothetical protein
VSVGSDPFLLISEGFECLSKRTGTFRTLKHKTLPDTVSLFGWCTWDAFYHSVHGQGIEAGLKNLAHGGTPARFLIIDDGWQVGSHAERSVHVPQLPLPMKTPIKRIVAESLNPKVGCMKERCCSRFLIPITVRYPGCLHVCLISSCTASAVRMCTVHELVRDFPV